MPDIPKLVKGLNAIAKGAKEEIPFSRGVKTLSREESDENLRKMLESSKIKERLFHATPEDIKFFKPGGLNPKMSGEAIWLSNDPKRTPAAHNIGSYDNPRSGVNVMPVHVQAKNPMMLDDLDMLKWAREVYAEGSPEFPYVMPKKWRDEVMKDYDSIILADPYKRGDSHEVIMFEPEKIKSAIGNRGTYNTDTADITKAKGGGVRMQVGGLMSVLNAGKAGAKLTRAEKAALRAQGLGIPSVDFADPLNPKDIMRMSEALGISGSEGKTLNLTQADRSRVFGPNKGGTGFSGLQLTSPPHQQAGTTWGVGKPSHVTRMINANTPDTVWSPFIGSPTQHMSNPVTVERMYEAHKNANPSAELVEKMNQQLNSAIHPKTKKPIFPNGIDISDPASLNQAQTFDQRKAIAQALTMGGEKKGEKATQEAFRIIKEETDPLLVDAPTYAVGNRLFTIDKNTGIYRPDLNSAFPEQTVGTDFGLIFEPAPIEFAAPDFVKKFEGRKNKHGNPQPMGHKDLTATTPKQFISEEYLTNLQKAGYKDGGSAEPPPFHDFEQIINRKDGGTVSTFEQRLKSALSMAMGGEVSDNTTPDMTDGGNVNYGGQYAHGGGIRMNDGGSYPPKKDVPAMTPQQYLDLLALQPKLGLQSEKQIKAKLEEQYRKEKEEGFGTPQARIDRAIKTVTPALGAVADVGNLAANIPRYVTEGISAAGNYAMSKIPSMSKPASVLDTEGTGDRIAKYPLQGLPEFDPFYGSSQMQQHAREAGLMGESESPVYDTAMAFLSPYGAAKAPSAIKGGLNMAKPVMKEAGDITSRAAIPIQRPFTPATFTVEGTAPDLGQGTSYGFRQGLNDVLIGQPNLGRGRNKVREGQGTYVNTSGDLELNPMLAIDVPRAGSIGNTPSANKALRQQIGQMGVDLNQEAMAGHRFLPLMTNNIKDASAMLIKTKEGLNAQEIKDLAKVLGGDMVVTHNPKLGGVVVYPFGAVEKGQIPEEFLKAQSVAGELLGKRGKVQFGVSDFNKDRLFMEKVEGDYQKAGAKPMSKEQQEKRSRIQGVEKFMFPESTSGIPGQVKASPIGGLQPWSRGENYPTNVIGIGNADKTQYQPVNFLTGKQGSRYDKYSEAENARAQMLDEWHRTLPARAR